MIVNKTVLIVSYMVVARRQDIIMMGMPALVGIKRLSGAWSVIDL